MSLKLTIVIEKIVEDQNDGEQLYNIVKREIENNYPAIKVSGSLTNNLEPSKE